MTFLDYVSFDADEQSLPIEDFLRYINIFKGGYLNVCRIGASVFLVHTDKDISQAKAQGLITAKIRQAIVGRTK